MNRPLRECANPGNYLKKQSQGGPNDGFRAPLNCYRSHFWCQGENVNVIKPLLTGGSGCARSNGQGGGDI